MKQNNEKKDTLAVFAKAPVPQAVLKNALPAMAAMLMTLIYNLADTFFIGQTDDALQVAAVSISTPVFLLFMSVGTLFGIGGTSVISRALGEGRREFAAKVCSFCMWGCVAAGILMSALFLIFMDPLLSLIGASEDTWGFAKTYLSVVTCGGTFSMISNCFANVLRAEGQTTRAMLGQIMGNLLNVVLDPILILKLDLDIFGCALATFIGQTTAALYYISFYVRKKSMLGASIRNFTLRGGVAKKTLAIGIPASLASILMSITQILLNSRMSGYGDMAVAAMGVSMKIVTITGMICTGLGQGVQPLLGYCVGAGNWKRYRSCFRFSMLFALALGVSLTIVCYLFINQIAAAFLSEPEALDYAVTFSKILLCTGFLYGIFYVLLNALQAMGAAAASLIINVSRQGIIFIPMLFILEAKLGAAGLVWAQPVSDMLSLILAAILFVYALKKRAG